MPAAAVGSERLAGDLDLTGVDWNDLHLRPMEQQVEPLPPASPNCASTMSADSGTEAADIRRVRSATMRVSK